MIRNVVLTNKNYFYPIGNTPAVCLTQDLPPDQDADILLLGCGDARNVLFTCFADAGRKIDVTCCDIEPGINARNVLLYSLMIDDTLNNNIEMIWNIYYHWKLDEKSLKLLETQTRKLLAQSKSIEMWKGSVYGSSIRFCDDKSLAYVRRHWKGFQFENLTLSEKAERLSQLKTAILKAREKRSEDWMDLGGLTSVPPAGLREALRDLSEVSTHWWYSGVTPSSSDTALKSIHFNPALLYSPNKALILHSNLSPLHGFPLSTAYLPVIKQSDFHLNRKSISSDVHLVNCAKTHFKLWAAAFRKALANQSVVRIFVGDAISFGLTLRNYQFSIQSCKRSIDSICNDQTKNIFKLYPSDYSGGKDSAPLRFNVVDTSNLFDHLGPLNVIMIGSSLLKNDNCIIYGESFRNSLHQMSGWFGVDVRLFSLLLGLVPPDLFTNASDSFEDQSEIDDYLRFTGEANDFVTQYYSRIRWRRIQGDPESSRVPCVSIEAEMLAILLINLYKSMFEYERCINVDVEHSRRGMVIQGKLYYNRASFALLLNILRTNVNSDWDVCVSQMYPAIIASSPPESLQDLFLNMHMFGVDSSRFIIPHYSDVEDSVLRPILPTFPASDGLPHQLCVTVRVSRKELGLFRKIDFDIIGELTIYLSFEGGDPGFPPWCNHFASVKNAFGTWCERESHAFIEEDGSQLSGTSDMFVSVMVPTLMLLQSKQSIPLVKCKFIPTPRTISLLSKVFDSDLCFCCKNMTEKDSVFVTQCMPGMRSLFTCPIVNAKKDKLSTASISLHLTQDGSKLDSLVQRINVEVEAVKTTLALKTSDVTIKFNSPLIATVSIAECHKLVFRFPLPVSTSNFKLRISRTSSFIEIESPLLDPLREDDASFLFPTLLSKTPCGANLPMPWTSTRFKFDAMPPIDVENKEVMSCLDRHIAGMFSTRERRIRKSDNADVRTELKDSLHCIFKLYLGINSVGSSFFGLRKTAGGYHTIILPSCLRLDLSNRTVLLDTAIIPLTNEMTKNDAIARQFLQELSSRDLSPLNVSSRHSLASITVSEAENRAWNAMMPAFVERCRAASMWNHTSSCEYLKAGEVPLPNGLSNVGVSPICSCGIGKFPVKNYLDGPIRMFPTLSHVLNQYATRAIIAPIFPRAYVEDCKGMGISFDDFVDVSMGELMGPLFKKFVGADGPMSSLFKNFMQWSNGPMIENKKVCAYCGRDTRKNAILSEQRLLLCSKCRTVSYCSKECQKADWKSHKLTCVRC